MTTEKDKFDRQLETARHVMDRRRTVLGALADPRNMPEDLKSQAAVARLEKYRKRKPDENV